jgi:mono/diheme cytochrome c family protein
MIGLLAVLLMTGAYYFQFEWNRTPRIDPTNVAQVETGKRIYALTCASCHGISLEGQANWQRRLPSGRLPAPPHDASGHTWHHTDEVLFRITKYGAGAYLAGPQTDMPAFNERLTDEQIASALAFIKSTWPAELREKQLRIEAKSRGLAR